MMPASCFPAAPDIVVDSLSVLHLSSSNSSGGAVEQPRVNNMSNPEAAKIKRNKDLHNRQV
jgi:hypothetical protein